MTKAARLLSLDQKAATTTTTTTRFWSCQMVSIHSHKSTQDMRQALGLWIMKPVNRELTGCNLFFFSVGCRWKWQIWFTSVTEKKKIFLEGKETSINHPTRPPNDVGGQERGGGGRWGRRRRRRRTVSLWHLVTSLGLSWWRGNVQRPLVEGSNSILSVVLIQYTSIKTKLHTTYLHRVSQSVKWWWWEIALEQSQRVCVTLMPEKEKWV